MTDCYSKSKDERADDAHAMPHAPFRCKGMIGMGFDPFKQVAVARYFLKACLLVAFVYLVSLALPSMPSPVVALVWAVFTVVSMLGLLYQMSINKAHRQCKYAKGGIQAWFNNGRLLRIIISFVASAIFIAGLFLESPSWDAAEWGLIAAAIVLYPLVEVAAKWWARREYSPLFQTSGTLLWACALVGLLLCAGYAAYNAFWPSGSQPQAGSSAFAILASTPRPLADASSALLQDAGIGSWIAGGAVNFGLAQVSQISWQVCFAIRVVLCASAFFGIANLLGVCSLPASELRKEFISTDAIRDSDVRAPIKKPYLAVVGVLAICLCGAFLWIDAKTADAMQTESGTALQSLARQLANQSVCVIDGKYYDREKISKLTSTLEKDEANLKVASLNLRDEISATYTASKDNVDEFLKWYFSIATNDSVRRDISGKDVRQVLEQGFYSIVTKGDDAQISSQVENYLAEVSCFQGKLEEGLHDAEINEGNCEAVPDWLFEAKDFTDASVIREYRQEVERVLDAARDSGIEGALSSGQLLLSYQFKNSVYGCDDFNKWVEAADEAVNDSNFAADFMHYWKGRFDQGNTDTYRGAMQSALDECQNQTMALVMRKDPVF